MSLAKSCLRIRSFALTKPTSYGSKSLSRSLKTGLSSRSFASMAAPIERICEKLETPALDDRSYRVVRLPNKLEALLVHDPDTDKASAAVNVNVGSFSDADDMPGMAHAVEHLLFMGTEKVPTTGSEPQLSTNSALVPSRECLQPVPDCPFWLFKCLHRAHRDELLL